MSNEVNFPIVWDDKYKKLGVTPEELYLRQNGLCYLVTKGGTVYCTDGKEQAKTAALLNPTFECVRCMVNYMGKITDAKDNS